MKKLLGFLIVAIVLQSCAEDCDPGLTPVDDNINIMIKTNTDAPYLSYPSGLPDSVRITNLATGARVVDAFMTHDSLLVIREFTKTNGATTNLRIAKGTILKPDTISVTVNRKDEPNNCGVTFNVARLASLKVNSTTLCTNCNASTKYRYTRP